MQEPTMRPRHLILRCYVERAAGQWQAFCVDLSLAAQGDSLEEAREKLDRQISEYVFDALVGEDRKHAGVLLTRKSPLRFRLRYRLLQLLARIHFLRGARPFVSTMPLKPVTC